jgi:hypothetical protein
MKNLIVFFLVIVMAGCGSNFELADGIVEYGEFTDEALESSEDLEFSTTALPTPAPTPALKFSTKWYFAGTSDNVDNYDLKVGQKDLVVFRIKVAYASNAFLKNSSLLIGGGKYCGFARKSNIYPEFVSSRGVVRYKAVNMTPPGPGGSSSKCSFALYMVSSGIKYKVNSFSRSVRP